MRHCRAFLTTALWLAPALVAAGPFDGVYRQTANAECALVGVDGGALRIDDSVFYGVDVQCSMTRPVDVNDLGATIYHMECAGEGQTWTERAMLMKDAEDTGIYMIWRGYAFRYVRCPESEG
jgi:hypothetical protein